MARKIEIPLSINPRELIRGLKLTEREFEQLEDTLQDVERAGDRMADDLENSFRDMDRAAERAGRDVEDGLRGGINKTSLGIVGAEVADEFVESWGEAVRSGNLSEALYETITNAGQIMAAAMPGIGTVVGMGVAMVGGIVQGIRENEQKMREAIADIIDNAATNAIDVGAKTGRDYAQALYSAIDNETQAREDLQAFFPDAGTFTEALAEANQLAADLGVEFDVVADAITGNVVEQQRAVDALTQQRDLIQNEINAAYEEAGGIIENLTLEEQQRVSELTAQRDALNDQLGTTEGMIGAARQVGDQLGTWQGYVTTAAEQARIARDYINGTRPPDMSQTAYNLERMAAAAVSTKYTLDQIRSKEVVIDVRVAGATGAGGLLI